MSQLKKTYLIDNNVFSDVTGSRDKTKRFIQFIQTTNKMIYIPVEVLFQRLQGNNIPAITESVSNFRLIMQSCHREHVRIAASFEFVLERELERTGKVRKFPEILAKDHILLDLFTQDTSYLHSVLKEHTEIELQRKQQFFNVDSKIKSDMKDVSQELKLKLADRIRNLENFTLYPDQFAALAPFFRRPRVFLSKRRFNKICRSRSTEYRCYKVAFNLLFLNRLLVHIDILPSDLQGLLGKAARVAIDDSVDMTLASTAAYADHFVTNDRALTQMCSYLKTRNLCDFETLSIEQFFVG